MIQPLPNLPAALRVVLETVTNHFQLWWRNRLWLVKFRCHQNTKKTKPPNHLLTTLSWTIHRKFGIKDVFSFLLRTRNSIRGFGRPLVHWSIHHSRVVTLKLKTRGTRIYNAAVGIAFFVSVLEGGWGWCGVRLGVGCPCPPVRNAIVSPRHLLPYIRKFVCLSVTFSTCEICLVEGESEKWQKCESTPPP